MNKKILLALMPHWSPLIPPMGLACLKSYLDERGFSVILVDANVEPRFGELTDLYFQRLREYIPPEKQGNLINTGDSVLHRHLMAHFRSRDRESYIQLVKKLTASVFFTTLSSSQVEILQEIVEAFFQQLEVFVNHMIENHSPNLLGLSVYSSTLPGSLFTFKWVKERFPHIKTIMGGGVFSGDLEMGSANFKFFLEQTPYIDKIFVGEGEELLSRYLQGKLPAGERVYSLDHLSGHTLDLAAPPVPDFSDFKLEFYPMIASYTSRSCPFNCSFCSEKVMWGRFRKKEASRIVQELSLLSQKHLSQLFLLTDSLLNPVMDDLSRELTAGDHSIYWDGYLRADASVCDPDRTLRWRQGGFYRARLGLESASPSVLKNMGKKINPQQMRDALTALAGAGIKTTTYWVIGYPGESEADFQLTLDFLQEMKDEIYEADCNPFTYHLTGQVNSGNWDAIPALSLYPENSRDMLLVQSHTLDTLPTREETYNRVVRFTQFCRETGIPNPYSLKDIHGADERWKNLHPNSVPSLLEFLHAGQKGRINIVENLHVEKIKTVAPPPPMDGDWAF